jgi:hypothetical protein
MMFPVRDAALNQRPVQQLPDQKLGLFAPFPVIVVRLVGPVPGAHKAPIHLIEPSQVVVPVGKRRESVPIRENEPAAGLPHGAWPSVYPATRPVLRLSNMTDSGPK